MMNGIRREPVIVVMSILAALQIFAGGLGTVTLLQGNSNLALIGALATLAVAAAQAGLQFYVRGQVTPARNMVPAADEATGTDEGLESDRPAARPDLS